MNSGYNLKVKCNVMTKNLLFICISLLLASCSSESSFKFTVKNGSDFDRVDQVLEIPVRRLEKSLTLGEGQVYNVVDDSGEVLPSQITYNNRFIFQPKLKAKEAKGFKIIASAPVEFEKQVDVKFRPERYDDMAWENDKVGFRFYGKALEAVQAPTNGLDIWCKRTNRLVLDEWYPNDISGKASYHVDHGEGADFYPVGRTLGAGSMSPFIDGKLQLNSNFVSHEILDNGPLRVSFKLTYPMVSLGYKELLETKTITLDAGSYLTKIVQDYNTDDQRDHFTVAAGFAYRGEENPITVYNRRLNYLIYDDPAVKENGNVYLGLIIPQGIEKNLIDTYSVDNGDGTQSTAGNVLASITYMPGAAPIYYVGFGWDKAGFETLESFEEYIAAYSRRAKEPFVVTYEDQK